MVQYICDRGQVTYIITINDSSSKEYYHLCFYHGDTMFTFKPEKTKLVCELKDQIEWGIWVGF